MIGLELSTRARKGPKDSVAKSLQSRLHGIFQMTDCWRQQPKTNLNLNNFNFVKNS